MKNIILTALLFILIAGISGCVSKPSKYAIKGYTSNPKISLAANVTKAAGLPKIKDVKLEKHQQQQIINNKNTLAGSLVFATASTLSDLNQLGMATFPLSFLTWSMMDAKGDLRVGRKFYSWMPREMAKTPEEAVEVLGTLLTQALRKTLEKKPLPEPYHVELDKPIPLQREKYTGKHFSYKYGYKVTGGECDNKPCSISCNYMYRVPDGDTLPYPGLAPDFLGGGEAWVFSRYTVFYPTFPHDIEKVPEYQAETIGPILLELSKQLPKWNYIYMHNFYATKEGKPFPIVLNEGEGLLFIKP